MSVIRVLAEKIESGEQKEFFVDNTTMLISEEVFDGHQVKDFTGFPAKIGPYSYIKIQLGLKCNYSCAYCSQGALPEVTQFSIRDLDGFVEKFLALPMTERVTVMFWGGEPLVYWKHIKYLVERIHKDKPDTSFGTVTNGSLLTKEIVDFFDDNNFYFSISHDGPGQSARGSDPLQTNREAIDYAITKLNSKGKISFNTMLSKGNSSRLAIIKYFESQFPGIPIAHGEMGFLKTTGQENHSFIELTTQEHFELRRNLWAELRFNPTVLEQCLTQRQQATLYQNTWPVWDMKCGVDKPNRLVIDLSGNVLTCQNINAETLDGDGRPRVHGNVFDDSAIPMQGVKHWTQRNDCSTCLVLKLCKGSCMMLEGKEWDLTCDIEYSDMVALFSINFEAVTGYTPVLIKDESLPLDRQDIWGSIFERHDISLKKVIPIIAVTS